jgi:hypothetical protein
MEEPTITPFELHELELIRDALLEMNTRLVLKSSRENHQKIYHISNMLPYMEALIAAERNELEKGK